MEKPDNKGQKRESLVILEKVDHYEGLLKSLATEADVSYYFLIFLRPASLVTAQISSADKDCTINQI